MNNNIIQQLVHFLTNGWQNPLPGMEKTFQQTGQNLQNTYWGQSSKPIANPTPTPHITMNSPWQVVNTANLPKQMPTATPTMAQAPPQMPQQTLGAQTSQLSPQEQQAAAIFQQYGINPQVGLSILKAEGGRIGTNNPGNVNATDSNPTGAYNYATPQAGIAGAAKTMRALLNKQGINSNDPNMQLQGIEQGGYAGDPKTWRQRSVATGGAGKQYPSWSSFVKATPTWNTWSQGGN